MHVKYLTRWFNFEHLINLNPIIIYKLYIYVHNNFWFSLPSDICSVAVDTPTEKYTELYAARSYNINFTLNIYLINVAAFALDEKFHCQNF